MKASRERGRPARTKPGTASAISPTCINRERRHGSPSAWPMRFPPTGWLPAASRSSSAATKGTGCGRDARAPRRCSPGGWVAGVWRATSQNADLHPLGNSRLPASRAPALPCGSFSGSRGRCGITGITLLNFRVLPDKTRTRDVPPNPSGGSRTPHASCHGGSAFPISTRNCRMRGQVIPLIQQRPQGLTTSPKTTGLPEPQAGTSTRCSRT